MSGMAEVLAAHRISPDFLCECDADFYPNPEDGDVSEEQEAERASDPNSFIKAFEAHQAAALTAAGFGPVKEVAAFTERQSAEWPKAVAEVQRYVDTSTVPTDLFGWTVQWADETRPGRGHHFDGTWADGEYFAQVRMDVYGYASVSVAETTWLHNSSDEECDCGPCAAVRGEG